MPKMIVSFGPCRLARMMATAMAICRPTLPKQPVQDQRAAEIDEQCRQPEQFLVGG